MRRPTVFAWFLLLGAGCSLAVLALETTAWTAGASASPLGSSAASDVALTVSNANPTPVTEPTRAVSSPATATPRAGVATTAGERSNAEQTSLPTTTPTSPSQPLTAAPADRVRGLPAELAARDVGYDQPDLASGLLDRMNAARLEEGLQPLARDSLLDEVALARARDLVAEGYFDHYAPDGASAFTELAVRGVDYGLAGENLARNNYPRAKTVDAAYGALMGSPGHRANILEPRFSRVGVAALKTPRMWLYVTVFTD